MSNKKINVACKNCGQAFSAFLRDMAEHSAKVACPNCCRLITAVFCRPEAPEGAEENRLADP